MLKPPWTGTSGELTDSLHGNSGRSGSKQKEIKSGYMAGGLSSQITQFAIVEPTFVSRPFKASRQGNNPNSDRTALIGQDIVLGRHRV